MGMSGATGGAEDPATAGRASAEAGPARVAEVEAARRELEEALGPDGVLADRLALLLYSRDASMVEGGCALVAFPRSVEDVQACVRIAARHGLPVVPRGSGTGLAGGATPIGDALVVSTARMHRILEVRPEDRLAWVEPGVINLDLQLALAPAGFTYAPDPSSQQTCSIGGNVNTNAGGPHCLAYGVTSNHVLAVDVVLPDGRLERFGSEGPEWPGLDLRGIVVGSEGTLGIVARVCVRLTPLPEDVRTMLFDFETVEDCAQTVSDIIASGVIPAAVEMMDHGIVVAAENFAHAGYPTDAAAILIVEVDGSPAAVAAQAEAVEAAARRNRARSVRVAADEAERALIWKGRKTAFGAVAQIAPHYHLHDCVVPRTKLVEVLSGVYEIARRHGLVVTNVFHAGDGNLHPLLSFDRRVPGTLERVLRASEEIVRLCVEAGGVLSGEHGIGLEKRDFMPLVFSAEDLAAQDCLRAAFDPERRMNPEKVLPEGARCGDFAMARGQDVAEAVARMPEGAWI
jgi:glycolate oxidase